MQKKTRRINLRLSEQEFTDIKRRAVPFRSASSFILAALQEFSDTTAKDNLESRNRLAEIYSQFDEKLAHVGGNLNQAMRRINEAAQGGIPYNAQFKLELMPRIEECYSLCIDLRRQLRDATMKMVRK